MVEINYKYIIFVVAMDLFILMVTGTMAASQAQYFSTEANTSLTGSELTSAFNSTTTDPSIFQASAGVGPFILFITTFGFSAVGDIIPAWISVPLVIFLWVLNSLLFIELISWIREMVGFT